MATAMTSMAQEQGRPRLTDRIGDLLPSSMVVVVVAIAVVIIAHLAVILWLSFDGWLARRRCAELRLCQLHSKFSPIRRTIDVLLNTLGFSVVSRWSWRWFSAFRPPGWWSARTFAARRLSSR